MFWLKESGPLIDMKIILVDAQNQYRYCSIVHRHCMMYYVIRKIIYSLDRWPLYASARPRVMASTFSFMYIYNYCHDNKS